MPMAEKDHPEFVLPVFTSCQTQKVYAWEDKVFTDCYITYLTLSECRELVHSLWVFLEVPVAPPMVYDGRGCAYARAMSTELHLPRWARNFTVLAHELAHCVTALLDERDSLDHGNIYMHVYMLFMAKLTGHTYSDLSKSARAYGLRIKRIKLKSRLKKLVVVEE